tara:strand:- start:16844 stop:18145 length:1302 start_codon:yes stop_codon:yes gene_type:complete
MNRSNVDSNLVILGGGLSAIYAAFKLSKHKPTIIFGQEEIGGILNSYRWKNYYVDNGCHFFDGNDEQIEFFKTVGGTAEHEVKYGSFNQGKLTNEIATPEINSTKMITDAINELKNLEDFEDNNFLKQESLKDILIRKFGKICGTYLSDIQQKFTGQVSENIRGNEFKKFSVFHRIRIGDDEISNNLKKTSPYLEDIICSSLESRGLPKYQKSMYPETHGSMGFVINSKKYLAKNNTNILNNFNVEKIKYVNGSFEIYNTFGTTYKTNIIISTLPPGLLAKLLGYKNDSLPQFINYRMVLLEIEKKNVLDTYYVQDFDTKNHTYRSSNMGYYSNQISNDGKTFVMSEIPYFQSLQNLNINKIKDELITHGLLKEKSKILDYMFYDKKNVVPINTITQKVSLPNNFYSIDAGSFSAKDKLSNIDLISDKLNNVF